MLAHACPSWASCLPLCPCRLPWLLLKDWMPAPYDLAAMAAPNVAKYTDGKTIKKVIFVPGKIMNLIVA
eukprot:1156476-Pelagomonas_calceolata.AAC.4